MNRIILIGNGFDIAHDLKTKFTEFLDYFWKKLLKEINESGQKKEFENKFIKIKKITPPFYVGDNYENLKNLRLSNYKIKNKFLEKISEKSNLESWVDIEEEYYLLLKNILLDKLERPDKNYSIIKLNKDFEEIKKELEQYIFDIEDMRCESPKKIKCIYDHIYSKFNQKDFSEKYLATLDTHTEFLKINKGYPNNILFLNFNYTKCYDSYKKFNNMIGNHKEVDIDVQHIDIHGSVYKNDHNPIIFGYGDEVDDDYKKIENKKDNKFLEHIKSIKYLDRDNYKNLLRFINGSEYHIFIFGHSCGNSDRTLLNTIFEHENCVSIKPFYYKFKEGEDNYSEIIMNITRNFNDKASLRDKVVNKIFCKLLLNSN